MKKGIHIKKHNVSHRNAIFRNIFNLYFQCVRTVRNQLTVSSQVPLKLALSATKTGLSVILHEAESIWPCISYFSVLKLLAI